MYYIIIICTTDCSRYFQFDILVEIISPVGDFKIITDNTVEKMVKLIFDYEVVAYLP